jgi:type II secretory pathway predicted ATPase ExeA
MAWKTVKTETTMEIGRFLDGVRKMGNMICVVGETGTGKTHAARRLAAKKANTFYVLGDVVVTKATFVDMLVAEIGIRTDVKSASAKINLICSQLSKMDAPVLIIDDAGKLKNTVLQLIQVLYDRLQGKAGILILGVPDLKVRVKKAVAAQRGFMPELSGRIAHWSSVLPQSEDIKEVCEKNGVTESCAIYISNATKSLHIAEQMVKKLLLYCQETGATPDENTLFSLNDNIDWHDKVVTK